MIQGKNIAITRSKDDSKEFIDLMTTEKANVLALPTIELVSKGEKIVEEFLSALEKENPDFSVFMSTKAVTILFDTAKKISKFETGTYKGVNAPIILISFILTPISSNVSLNAAFLYDSLFSTMPPGKDI